MNLKRPRWLAAACALEKQNGGNITCQMFKRTAKIIQYRTQIMRRMTDDDREYSYKWLVNQFNQLLEDMISTNLRTLAIYSNLKFKKPLKNIWTICVRFVSKQ